MAPVARREGIDWHRPLLAVRRASLRDYLTMEGIPWVEDPTNEDERFDRVKARKALAALVPLGIEASGLVQTAERMALARRALEVQTRDLARAVARADRGDVVLDWEPISNAPQEVFERLLSHVLQWVSGAEYRPRLSALGNAITAISDGRTTVLSGCLISTEGPYRRVTRELAAVVGSRAMPGEVWDGRWRLDGPESRGVEVAALGENGIRDCPHWRDTGLPRTSLIASPAIWQENRLIAAPVAGFGNGWQASPVRPDESLIEAIITH
jgi:tRNA(Ile)-lysidine synthase